MKEDKLDRLIVLIAEWAKDEMHRFENADSSSHAKLIAGLYDLMDKPPEKEEPQKNRGLFAKGSPLC